MIRTLNYWENKENYHSDAPSVSENCLFTTDTHHSPTLVEGNCPLSLLARALSDNEVVQESQLDYGDYTEHLNINSGGNINAT